MATHTLKAAPKGEAAQEIAPMAWPARLLWLEPFWVGGMALLVLLPEHLPVPIPYPWLVVGLFFFWPLRWLSGRPLLTGTSMDVFLALFLLWLPIPLWLSVERAHSWQAVGLNLAGVAAAVALLHWPPSQKQPLIPTLLLAAVSLALALASPYLVRSAPQKLFAAPSWQTDVTAQSALLGETVNPNVLAGALILPVPLLAALSLQRRRGAFRLLSVLWALPTAILIAATILTQSRGAYAGLASGLWVVFLLQWPRWRYGWIGLLVAGLGLLIWWGPSQFLDQSAYVGTVDSFAGRMEIWSRAWTALQDFPLTGLGPGLFGVLMPRLYPYFSFSTAAQIPHAHNLYLQVALDLGCRASWATAALS